MQNLNLLPKCKIEDIVFVNKNETKFGIIITNNFIKRLLIGEYILALLNALKSCSISFKSGEYFGKNSNW